MTLALAFDIYGTLIDPHGVVGELRKHLGDSAPEFSRIWREKQLEYSWRRGLMKCYQDFSVCTRQALDYANQFMQAELDEAAISALMQCYRELPAFSDVSDCLSQLSQEKHKLFAFSNGTADMVNAVLAHAGINHFFDEVISVDTLQTFKPDPAVYYHVAEKARLPIADCWLVSSNSFDVIGAVSVGMKAAWVQRSTAIILDPWEVKPTRVIEGLGALPVTIR